METLTHINTMTIGDITTLAYSLGIGLLLCAGRAIYSALKPSMRSGRTYGSSIGEDFLND